MLEEVQSLSVHGLTNKTKCPISCTVSHYSLAECKSVPVTWKHDWSSAFYLAAEKTEVRQEEEFWVFDLSDTINGIGGAMGLFLGWSILYLIHQLVKWLKIAYTCFRKLRLVRGKCVRCRR